MNDEEYINWLKLTKELLNKHDLKEIKVKIKEISSFDKQENKLFRKKCYKLKLLMFITGWLIMPYTAFPKTAN